MNLLPPSEFSNIINEVKPEFDFSKWQDSPEWAIFNAGRKEAANLITYYAENVHAIANRELSRLKEKR